MQLLLQPHHHLMGPFELTGPHRQPEQDQRDAAWSGDRSADDAEGDQNEAENADCHAIDHELALVLPDLAAPAPAVLFRLDEDVVVVMVMRVLVAAGAVTPAGANATVGLSASRESRSSAPDDMATTLGWEVKSASARARTWASRHERRASGGLPMRAAEL